MRKVPILVVRRHLTYANVAATLALFLALTGGVVYAADKIGSKDIAANAVKSKHIAKKQVKNADLGHNAVTSTNVKNGSLLSQDFAKGQGLEPPNITVRSGASGTCITARCLVEASVGCNSDEQVLGGGASAGPEDHLSTSEPYDDSNGSLRGWRAEASDSDADVGNSAQVFVFVLCASF